MIEAGHRVVGFGQATSDLEEIFLKVTGQDDRSDGGMTATAEVMRPARRSAFREFLAGVGTIMVKELRSRMRGRRAFVVLTIYLGLLALITYGSYLIVAPTARGDFGGVVNPGQHLGHRRPDDLHAALDLPAHPHLLHRPRLHGRRRSASSARSRRWTCW